MLGKPTPVPVPYGHRTGSRADRVSGHRLVSVERTRVGRVKVVHLSGEVDRLNVPDLDGFLAETAAGTDDVVVGLGSVTYLDLGGVAFIDAVSPDRPISEPAPSLLRDPQE